MNESLLFVYYIGLFDDHLYSLNNLDSLLSTVYELDCYEWIFTICILYWIIWWSLLIHMVSSILSTVYELDCW